MSVLLLILLFVAAVLYTAAGQAGASGYLAVMALVGTPQAVMKPTALSLNVLVATFGTWRLWRAGWTDWRGLWPWLLGSVPLSFLGGAIALPGIWYRLLLGPLLVFAGLRLWIAPAASDGMPRRPVLAGQVIGGGMIGLLSGLTGVGGGVLLGPLLLLLRWADPRHTAGLTTPFILVNSAAALAGGSAFLRHIPAEMPLYAVATMAGAALGTHLVIHRFSPDTLRRAMAVVLILGGCIVLLGAWNGGGNP